MRLIFLGSPGVGKGTQAKRLSREYHIPHIATGDMLRAAILKGEAVGQEAKAYVDSGRLVPDDVVIRIVKERLLDDDMKAGFIMDGFPRTEEQATVLAALQENNPIDRVIYFYLDEEELVARLSGRRSCTKCYEIYHTTHRIPKQEGICDHCGASLIQRKDDRSETIKERLRIYKKETAPLIQFYDKKGCLSKIDASGMMEEVEGRIRNAMFMGGVANGPKI